MVICHGVLSLEKGVYRNPPNLTGLHPLEAVYFEIPELYRMTRQHPRSGGMFSHPQATHIHDFNGSLLLAFVFKSRDLLCFLCCVYQCIHKALLLRHTKTKNEEIITGWCSTPNLLLSCSSFAHHDFAQP